MRDIKFRAWDKIKEKMDYNPNFDDIVNEARYIFMQYTGLKDKAGVEIYEGDILHITTEDMVCLNYKTVVEWTKQGYYSDFMNYSKAKVIGNIYENKEVLK